ncbi:hypothetical protein NDU88_002964 [Pleurodeles waltl]|uniref:Uncharacterized protein n=1 Tax=Pleurodeles waltl TaxID=8319 RepID=A0AAV7UC14_PLEWA|nr:hypothetical protein NDU88_002964 [Pleurodeles waltl]
MLMPPPLPTGSLVRPRAPTAHRHTLWVRPAPTAGRALPGLLGPATCSGPSRLRHCSPTPSRRPQIREVFSCPPGPATLFPGNEGLDYSLANREKPYFILDRYA